MKRILRLTLIVVALLVVVALALPFLIDANVFRPALESRLSGALGRQVTLGDLRLAILSGGVTASELTVSEDPAFGTARFLRAKSLAVGVDLAPLIFSRRLNVRSLTVDGPEISLLQNDRGVWNFSSLGRTAPAADAPAAAAPANAPQEAPLDLSVQLIRISNASLTLSGTRAGSTPRSFENVNLEIRDFAPAAQFPVSLKAQVVGGGDVSLEGTAGPLASGGTALTPFEARLILARLDLVNSGFASPSGGAAGLLSVDATAKSDGSRLDIQGDASLRDWKLARNGTPAAEPLEASFALNYDRPSRRGVIERVPVRFGGAEVALTGGYSLSGDSPVIDTKLSAADVSLTALAPILPAIDVVLPAGATVESGTLTLDLASQGPFDELVTSGSVSIADAALANFSLSDKLKALQQLSGIKAEPKSTIQQFASAFQISPQGTNVSNVRLVVPAVGEIEGAGTISPDHKLDFRTRATVRAETVLAALGRPGEGLTLPLLIQGTSANPSFKVDLKGAAADKLGQITHDPSSAIDAAKGLLNLFKKAPKPSEPPQQ